MKMRMEMSLLKIRIRDCNALTREKYKEQIKNRDRMDDGFDLYLPDTHIVKKLTTSHTLDHKVQIEYFRNELEKAAPGLSAIRGLKPTPSYILMIPRSSISKTSLRLSNSIGLIDSGYRGNLMAKVDNLGSGKEVRMGTALFQLIVGENCDVQIVEELSESNRGSGGFGSTGNTL